MIRYCEMTDIDSVYELVCELENTAIDREAFVECFQMQFHDDRYHCFLFEEEHAIKGMLNMRIESQLHHGGRIAEIMELVVADACRGNGIGSLLLDQAIEFSRKEGCLRIELSSSCWRKDAHRFYQEHGFELSHVNLTRDL